MPAAALLIAPRPTGLTNCRQLPRPFPARLAGSALSLAASAGVAHTYTLSHRARQLSTFHLAATALNSLELMRGDVLSLLSPLAAAAAGRARRSCFLRKDLITQRAVQCFPLARASVSSRRPALLLVAPCKWRLAWLRQPTAAKGPESGAPLLRVREVFWGGQEGNNGVAYCRV
jgi:hypothetical protein